MDPVVWRLQRTHATLDTPAGRQASLDLSRPWLGMRIAGLSEACRFLGVAVPCVEPVIATYDSYVRGRDLVATYEQNAERPIRTTLYWRALDEADAAGARLAIELVVSVQTSLLESRPTLEVQSDAPAAAVPLPPELRDCSLLRLAGSDESYLELLHPTAFATSGQEVDGAWVRLRHRLFFPEDLEKGVILRARLRAIMLPTAGDSEAAAGYHRSFLASPPPLTT
ncbi:MAG: hypothetical protein U0836_15835 [Pirellulales bacterium]